MFTGERSILGRGSFLFGVKRPPTDFPSSGGGMSPDMPQGGGRPGGMMLSAEDLPIEFMFSSMLSSLVTMLIFLVVILSVISVIHLHLKIKKSKKINEDFVIDTKIKLLSDEVLERIVDYGINDVEGDEIDNENS